MRLNTRHPKTFLRTKGDSPCIFTLHTKPPRSNRRMLNPLIGEIVAIYRAEQKHGTARKRFTSYCGCYSAPIFHPDFRVRVSHQCGFFNLAAAVQSAHCYRWLFASAVESSDLPLFFTTRVRLKRQVFTGRSDRLFIMCALRDPIRQECQFVSRPISPRS